MIINKRSLLFLSLLTPLLVLTSLVVKTELEIQHGKRLLLSIEGYDPRDYLRGHYINFRYRWEFDEEKTKRFTHSNFDYHRRDVHLCIPENKKVYPVLASQYVTDCNFRILGKLTTNYHDPKFNFNFGIEKFYVPERYALLLERELGIKKGEVELAVNSQGRAVILELYIGGVPWRDIPKEF